MTFIISVCFEDYCATLLLHCVSNGGKCNFFFSLLSLVLEKLICSKTGTHQGYVQHRSSQGTLGSANSDKPALAAQ